MTEVVEYQYAWNISDQYGHLRIKLKNKAWSKWKKFTDVGEFQILISMLQNEKPVLYGKNEGKFIFGTTKEPVGEEEF